MMFNDSTPCAACGRLSHRALDSSLAAPPVAPSGPTLSVIVPLLNEAEVIAETYRRLKGVLEVLGESYELIFVDDGSTDCSRVILAVIALDDPTVRVIALSRNFGHEMATTAGLHHARGRAAVVIDADLQDPPELIAAFVAKWRQGYQVVYGVREQRKGESMLKKATSWAFYRLMGRIADVPMPADTGDFRLMDRRVLDVYRQFNEEPRFFRGLVSWVGFKQIGVPFVRRPRAAGTTKYRYGRLLRLAFDTITAFSTLPAHLITMTAAICASLSVVFSATILTMWLTGALALQGWMWAGLGFLTLFNVQFVSMAVLGEYVVRTHRHTQRRPLYVVEAVIEDPRSVRQSSAPISADSEAAHTTTR